MSRILLWLMSPIVIMFYSIKEHQRATIQVILATIKNDPKILALSDKEQAEVYSNMLYRSGVTLGTLRTLFTLMGAAGISYLLIKFGV